MALLAKMHLAMIAVAVLAGLVVAASLWRFFRLWTSARLSGSRVTAAELVGMWLHGVDAGTIVNARTMTEHEGLGVPTAELEAHARAGGDVIRVVNALVIAHRAKLDMTWKKAAAMDLAGQNVLKVVTERTRPDPTA